ncbi:MAG TPA: FAD-binding protein [Myxococcaceae bacterium]|nr:FAD-binding protein [Myxococcaceae bacterium]
MTDVLVIGGGMAGAIAALSARRRGASVLVARRSLGATALSSGAIDVAPDPAAPSGDLRSQLVDPEKAAREVARTRPHHPYAVLQDKLPRLMEALHFAAQQLPGLIAAPLAINALLPSPLGTVKPCAMGQLSQVGADVSSLPAAVAVVQLTVNPAYDARLVARGIESAARSLGRKLSATVIESRYFHAIEDALRSPQELAELLDRPGALEDFARDLRPRLPAGVEALLFPPVFGRRAPGLVIKLSELLGGIRCAEILSEAPSVPGLRLQEALDDALARERIELLEAEVSCNAKAGVFTLGATRVVEPKASVLATGKFIGGGIVREEEFREPLLNLPVYAGSRRLRGQHIGDLLAEDVRGDQQAFRAGVRIDASLRPLGADGLPIHPRLYAAGSVISGYDPAADKTGLGVAIFTGYLAGEAAGG